MPATLYIVSVSIAYTNTMTSFEVAYLRIFRESNVLCGDEIGYIELYFQPFSLSSSESVLKALAMGAYDAGPNPEASARCFFNRDIACEC